MCPGSPENFPLKVKEIPFEVWRISWKIGQLTAEIRRNFPWSLRDSPLEIFFEGRRSFFSNSEKFSLKFGEFPNDVLGTSSWSSRAFTILLETECQKSSSEFQCIYSWNLKFPSEIPETSPWNCKNLSLLWISETWGYFSLDFGEHPPEVRGNFPWNSKIFALNFMDIPSAFQVTSPWRSGNFFFKPWGSFSLIFRLRFEYFPPEGNF